MSYSFESLIRSTLSMEDEDESRIPVEDAVDLDDSDTPTDEGETVEDAADNAEKEEADDTEDEAGESDDLNDDEEGAEDQANEILDENAEAEENGDDESDKDEDAEEDDESSDDDESDEEVTEEDKEEAAEALENIRDAMLDTLNRGGMTESEATVADMAIRDVAENVRLEDRRMVASVESFSERSSRRLLATNSAIDTLNFYIAQLRNK